MRPLLILVLCFLYLSSSGQSDSLLQRIDSPEQDSVSILNLEDFLSIILDNHPVVKQAFILSESAEANLMSARGAFDPKVSIDYDLKNFDKKNYYDLFNATLKVPTWIGIEPKIGLDKVEGQFVNQQSLIPDENRKRQVTAGVSIPVGKGLFIDERRATLKQAKRYQNIAEAEQNKMLNKILLKATKDYWDWFLAFQELDFLEFSIDIAEEIYRRVKIDYQFGEAAQVDTILAKINLQTRQTELAKIRFQMENSRLNLALHLWSPEGMPVELKETTIPDTLAYPMDVPTREQLRQLTSWAVANHPEIQKIINKIGQLEVQNRLNKEMLKPQVDLSYSFIDAPFSYGEEANSFSFDDNYKLGVAFSFPLLLRKERGKIQKTNLKIQENNFELNNQKLKIRNSLLSKYAEIQMNQTLTNRFLAMTESYESLLTAEAFNFELGESDLFKLNIQLDKYIESRIKYLENLTKLQKSKVELLYESGSLFREYQ